MQHCEAISATAKLLYILAASMFGNRSSVFCIVWENTIQVRYSKGPLSQRSTITKIQGGLDWIQTIFFF